MAAYAIQFRRGTTTQHSSFTGLLGEVTVDTDKKTLVVHDGSTTGGFPLSREGAAATSSTGSFTSNVSVGGTLAVTSTSTFGDDVGVTGDLTMTGHILPSANITYDLGSTTHMWRDIYVGPGSLYVNGKKVIEDDSGSISITTEANEDLKVSTTGTGTLKFISGNGINFTGELGAVSGDLQIGDHIDMNSNLIKELATPVSGTDAANKNYVDSAAASAVTGGGNAVSGTTGAFSSDVTITGDLTVNGTTTSINTTQIDLADNILLLNSDATGSATASAGLEVERGDDLNVQFLWDEANDRWTTGAEDFYTTGTITGDLTGDVTGTVSSIANHSTDDLSVGTTNKYFTNALADARIALQVGSNLDLSSMTTANLTEDSSNKYYTDTRVGSYLTTNSYATESYVNTAVAGKDQLSELSGTTDDVTEGSTNKYFSNTLAQGAISVSGDLSYNSGVVSFTERTDAEVTTLAKAAISASGDLSYSNGVVSFTERTDAEVTTLAKAAISVGGDLSYNNGVVSYTTPAEVDNYVDSLSFSGGTLTVGRTGALSDLTVDITTATTMKHTHGYSVSADDESDNTGSTHSITWSTLNGTDKIDFGSNAVAYGSEIDVAPFVQVFINRMVLRPNEVTITSSGVTFASGVVAEDDELEIMYMDEK
jgi:hypothetical protein